MALRLLVSAQGDPERREFRYDFGADRAQILLGRRGGVDVLLPHPNVSMVHARIDRRGDGYALLDERSTNGTFLNGARLDPGVARPLAAGDAITIGGFHLQVATIEAEAAFAGDSSISIARRMVAEVLGVLGPGGEDPSLQVTTPASGARLQLTQSGRDYFVGRDPSCDLRIDDGSLALRHARLRRDERGVTASDLSSPSGLYVNDRFVPREALLRDGDLLALGRVRLRFADPAEVYLRRLEQVPTPEDQAPREPAPAPRRRGELTVVAVAAAVALAAAAGLLWLLW
jgi:pSer/pThr/pTyr-binding forkhead associated (FHA) protein